MKTVSARDAKDVFALRLDTARAEPVAIAKHGRPVAVVVSVAEYDRLLRLTKGSGKARSARNASERTGR